MYSILSALDSEFKSLDLRSRELLAKLSDDQLFAKPRAVAGTMTMFSCGEYTLPLSRNSRKNF